MLYKSTKNFLLTAFAFIVLIPCSIVVLGTFKTDAEYYKERVTGYIPEYKCIRMKVENGGNTYDFPVHSEEEWVELTRIHQDHIIDIYPTTTFYDWDEY